MTKLTIEIECEAKDIKFVYALMKLDIPTDEEIERMYFTETTDVTSIVEPENRAEVIAGFAALCMVVKDPELRRMNDEQKPKKSKFQEKLEEVRDMQEQK